MEDDVDGIRNLVADGLYGSSTPRWTTHDANLANDWSAVLAWIVDSVPACPVLCA